MHHTIPKLTLSGDLARRFTAYRMHRIRSGLSTRQAQDPETARFLLDYALAALDYEYRELLPLVPEDDEYA